MTETENVIFGINGPVVTVAGATGFSMQEMVYVGNDRLVGEVIGIDDKKTIIQVYEVTTGLSAGQPVIGTGHAMSVTLGPGIISNIFDGIERPLKDIEAKSGAFMSRGSMISPLDREKLWDVTVCVKAGDRLNPGEIYAVCPETESVEHRCMVPPNVSGTVVSVASDGMKKTDDTVVTLQLDSGKTLELGLSQQWPIRVPRPVKSRMESCVPLITGQRVVDTLFPIAKGGTAAVPGGFGTGKTMMQHQLAKWCDADIIIYVGCGERGNEMTQVLDEFGALIDPKTGRKLTDRTLLIANTSNMPVAAREASIYTGITLAEYYRDMGYDVAMMADSTSRWAEALREISGRLEEMPAEEGFPAYLPSRLSAFYERAGMVTTLCGKQGSVSVIGAVSPQGSDFSEPVTQNTKRFVRTFWALDKELAYARHYPAVNWTTSYSECVNDLSRYYEESVAQDFINVRSGLITILREETSLMEIVKLIGADVLPDDQKLIISIARVIRAGFLQQNAYHKDDTFVPISKQYLMMKAIMHLYDRAKDILTKSIPVSRLDDTGVYDKLIRMKYDIPNDRPEMFDEYMKNIDDIVDRIINSKGGAEN